MSTFDDPNREAVGQPPIWTGAGEGGPAPEPAATGGGFDPADHTVAEVLEYLEDHPEDEDRIFDLETKGKNRTSIVGSD